MYESIYVQCDGEYEIIRICNAFFILCTQLNASSAFHSPAFPNQQILDSIWFELNLFDSSYSGLTRLDLVRLESICRVKRPLRHTAPLPPSSILGPPPLKSIFSMFQMIFCTKHFFDLVNFSFFFLFFFFLQNFFLVL